MCHLLIERVFTVTSEFRQYQARVQVKLNQMGIERIVEWTDLFTALSTVQGESDKASISFSLFHVFIFLGVSCVIHTYIHIYIYIYIYI